MGFWNWITRWRDAAESLEWDDETLGEIGSAAVSEQSCPAVNPATGLPMVDCSMDVAGNPFGTGEDSIQSGWSDGLFSDAFSDSLNETWADPFDDWAQTDDIFGGWDD